MASVSPKYVERVTRNGMTALVKHSRSSFWKVISNSDNVDSANRSCKRRKAATMSNAHVVIDFATNVVIGFRLTIGATREKKSSSRLAARTVIRIVLAASRLF